MTEKRFKEIISTQKVIDTVTNKEYDCLLDNDFYDLVNSLAEENEQLKQQLRTRHIVQKQYEENKKLKQENQRLKCINKQLEERLGRSLALDMEECG